MSRAVVRRYRVRFAIRGAVVVDDSTTEFILDISDLAGVPVVAGSFVHPLDGATETRPLQILGVDRLGGLIAAFTDVGRWAMVGRLLDIQWQDAADDPDSDPWTTYGTGRCSGLDEGDGPGRFRIEIADESWVSRRTEVFSVADTTQIWPSGVRGEWRGYPAAQMAWAEPVAQSGDAFRIRMWAGDLGGSLGPVVPPYIGGYEGREVTPLIANWARRDLKVPDDRAIPGTSGGNWTHLRLKMLDDTTMMRDWEIITFGDLAHSAYSTDIMFYLDNPEVLFANTIGETYRIYLWVRAPSGVEPYNIGLSSAWLYAPTAPPDSELPLHLGVVLNTQHDLATHAFGQDESLGTGGFMHVADATRRVWDAMEVIYDAANLATIEADTSFPLIAPRIFGIPADAERMMQDRWWGPLMLVALKDARGRRKLKDIRPPDDDADLSALPVLTDHNSDRHRWRLVGREQMNSVAWQYHRITVPGEPTESPGRTAVRVINFNPNAETLDWFITEELETVPYESDNVDFVGRRQKKFDVQDLLADPRSRPSQITAALASGLGQPFLDAVVTQMGDFLLGVYQDGPYMGAASISGALAETLEEGDYAIVDCASVKIANAGTSARFGHLLVLLLSLTRHPAHAEIEYIVVRPALLFICPTPEDPSTWLVSPLGQIATVRLSFGVVEPDTGDQFIFNVTAQKSNAGGQQVNMGVALYEGSTLIADWLDYDISELAYDYEYALDSTTQAMIVDWSNLFLEITRGGDTGGAYSTYRRLEVLRIWV